MMKEKLVMMVASMVVANVDPEKVNRWADYGLDLIEDATVESVNTVDDKLVIPMCKAAREAFNIPDND